MVFELALKNHPGLRRVLKMLYRSVDEISIGTINIRKLDEVKCLQEINECMKEIGIIYWA
jgi:hypothetical protein